MVSGSAYMHNGLIIPFTFKVMVDMYDPITVCFHNCFGFIFCRSFPSLVFPPREVPLAFSVKLVWWY